MKQWKYLKWVLLGLFVFMSSYSVANWRRFPVAHQNMDQEFESDEVPWSPPNYLEKSRDSLGWDENTFAAPEGMKKRVGFWVKIYSEYTTLQGVIHDSNHVHIIYGSVDFNEIMNNEKLSDRAKKKQKTKLVKEKKLEVTKMLKKLHKVKDPSELQGEELRIWKEFETVTEKNKFLRAARRNRVRFQLGQSDRFIKGIFYSGRYLKQMEETFMEEKLPIELTRLPFVESSFNIFARSRVGASGIWQIMPGTGREYRLRVNSRVDERNDPFKATEAAARILKDNYRMLKSWPLALTAYNHGAFGLRRIVRRRQTTDLVEIIEKATARRFGFASENFYASFLAALEVEQSAKDFFGEVKWSKKLNKSLVDLDRYLSWSQLVKWFDGDEEMTRIFNPHILYRVRKGYLKIPKGSYIRVPSKNLEITMEWLKKNPKVLSAKGRTYRVHRGDTLSHIASKFRIRISALKDANNISDPRRLRVGQKLVIPD